MTIVAVLLVLAVLLLGLLVAGVGALRSDIMSALTISADRVSQGFNETSIQLGHLRQIDNRLGDLQMDLERLEVPAEPSRKRA